MFVRNFQNFIWGISLPWQSVKLLTKNRSLLLISAMPVFISITLLVFTYDAATDSLLIWVKDLFTSRNLLNGEHSQFGNFGLFLASWTLKLTVFIILVFSFSYSVMILSTPFNEWLSNKTEAILGISVQTDGSSWSLFFKQISIDLLKTVFAICIIFLSLVLTLVPLINALVPFLTSYVFAFQFLTYSQTRRKMGLNQSLGFIFNHPFECLGFGIVTGLGFSVPIFSLFFLPLSVIGGTLLFSRFNK